jgi:hypothetical protein
MEPNLGAGKWVGAVEVRLNGSLAVHHNVNLNRERTEAMEVGKRRTEARDLEVVEQAVRHPVWRPNDHLVHILP